MSELATSIPARPRLAEAGASRGFYLFQAALMTAIVIAGFWPFYAELPHARGARPPIVYVHAAAFTAWLGLFAIQAALIHRRNVRVHRRLGIATAWYAVLLIVLGFAVAFETSADHVRTGEWTLDYAAGFLVLPFGDMLLFGGFLAAAVYHRRRPELHKRLMLLASVALIFPGAARFAEPNIPLVFVMWFLPVFLAMAYDRLAAGRVHRVYYAGCIVMLIFFARVAIMTAEPWLKIGRAAVTAFL